MKILLTGGASGQVAWEVIQQSKNTNNELIALGRDQLDITDEQAINKSLEQYSPDILINAAAYTAVDKAEEEQATAFQVNRDGVSYLAQACNKNAIPMLHISTDYVFDGEKNSPYEVDDAVAPQSIYGVSKWEGEESLRNTLTQHIILRTSWVFGRNGNNFVKTMLRLGHNRKELSVVADQKGAPTSAQSIAACLLALCERYKKEKTLPWGTYHFTGAPESTWFEFAKNIFDEAQKLGILKHEVNVIPIKTEDYPTLAKRPANSRLSTHLTQSRLGIAIPNWQDDLLEVLEYLKN